jgi:hypothetical protein
MRNVIQQFSEAARWVADVFSRLSIRNDREPIETVDRFFSFVSTRAALVTQKKLYGYLKERIGIRYPAMFEDEQFARSINIAKMHVFAAGLSDLTVFAVGLVSANARMGDNERRELAQACYRAGIADNAHEVPEALATANWATDFDHRLDNTLWENVGAGANPFSESPKALIRWAPIADEHKRYDREIVENSMRFAWNEIRKDLRDRLNATAVLADWKRRAGRRAAAG